MEYNSILRPRRTLPPPPLPPNPSVSEIQLSHIPVSDLGYRKHCQSGKCLGRRVGHLLRGFFSPVQTAIPGMDDWYTKMWQLQCRR